MSEDLIVDQPGQESASATLDQSSEMGTSNVLNEGLVPEDNLVVLDKIAEKIQAGEDLTQDEKEIVQHFHDTAAFFKHIEGLMTEDSRVAEENKDDIEVGNNNEETDYVIDAKEEKISTKWEDEHIDDRTDRQISEIDKRIAEINGIFAHPEGHDDNELQALEKEKSDKVTMRAFHILRQRKNQQKDEEVRNESNSTKWEDEHIDDRTDRQISEIDKRIAEINGIFAHPEGHDDNELQALEKEKSDKLKEREFHSLRQRGNEQKDSEDNQNEQIGDEEVLQNTPSNELDNGSAGKELELFNKDGKELEPVDDSSKELEPMEEADNIKDKLSLGSLRIGDIATRIREAAERDLMTYVNTGGVLKRTWRKITRLNSLIREPWLQKRTETLTELIKGKDIEDLYAELSSLDADAKDTATNELVVALLDDSGLARTEQEESTRLVGTGNEELDKAIRTEIKTIVSEYLSIKNPTPQQKEEYKKKIATYMEGVATANPDLLGFDKENNFLGFGGEELLDDAERLKNTLNVSMDHEDAMDRVNSSLEDLELVFGQMQSGANGELAHTKFNDTMEKLKSKDTKLGRLARDQKGFATVAAIAFAGVATASRIAPSAGARILAVSTLGIGAGASAYFARRQARQRSETDTALANVLAGSSIELGRDGEYSIEADASMQSRQYETQTYDGTIDIFTNFMDISDSGEVTIKPNLTTEQFAALASVYAETTARLDLQRTTGANLFSTVKGQSIKGGLNRLSKVLNVASASLQETDASATLDIDGQPVSVKDFAKHLEAIKKTELAEMIASKDQENQDKIDRDGRRAAAIGVATVLGGSLAVAELSSVIAGRGLQNPVTLASAYFRPSLDVPMDELAGTPPLPEDSFTTTIESSTVTAPKGSSFEIQGDTATFTTADGTEIGEIPIGKNGKISEEGVSILKAQGLEVAQVKTIQTETVTKTMSPERFMNKFGGTETPTVNWLDNGTPAPEFDGLELGQQFSMNKNGDIVITQGVGRAFGNGETINVMQAAKNGNLSVILSVDGHGVTLPMQVNGNSVETVIPVGSPEYNLFEVDGSSIKPKVEYVQVGRINNSGGVSSVSTVVGSPSKITAEIPIDVVVTDIEITPTITDAEVPADDFVPFVWPYGFANDPNRAERVKDDSEKPTSPSQDIEKRSNSDIDNIQESSGGAEQSTRQTDESSGNSEKTLESKNELVKNKEYLIRSNQEDEYVYNGYDNKAKRHMFTRVNSRPGYKPLALSETNLDTLFSKGHIKSK